MFTYLVRARNKKGFTIIELIVVVAIITVMSAVAVPNIINSNRRAEAQRHNGHARAFYLAMHQVLAGTMQNDNTEQEFEIEIGGVRRGRITGTPAEPAIAGSAEHFFLYVEVTGAGFIEYADLTFTTPAIYVGPVEQIDPHVIATYTRGTASTDFSDGVLAKMAEELGGYSEVASQPGSYFVMFDSNFRVLIAYYSAGADRARARTTTGGAYSFGQDNRIAERTFGAYPREYTFIGGFNCSVGCDGCRHNRTSGRWFGTDAATGGGLFTHI
jgi:prepilin-type N-terminal cleavage/methylation domain-containing protein